MILDVIPFLRSFPEGGSSDLHRRAIDSFVSFLERKLGVIVVHDPRSVPFGPENSAASDLAELLERRGIMRSLVQVLPLPDEPPIKYWNAISDDSVAHPAGGSSASSDVQALLATIAETLERYLWTEADDYFISPLTASDRELSSRPHIRPDRFAGFSDKQRKRIPELAFDDDTPFLWIKGMSLVQEEEVYLPAQTVSGQRDIRMKGDVREPLVRTMITTGLATWPTLEGARLSGLLEVIERDAYMIAWLNQLTLPRLSIKELCAESPPLAEFVARCFRYRLKPHVLRLITDAPTYAICVVLEDMSGLAPRFTIGLKAHRSLPHAVEEALLEAVRARRGYHHFIASGKTWDIATPVHNIGHRDRLFYWGVPDHARHLEFFIAGSEERPNREAWESDSSETHLARLIDWCSTCGYECVSVSLGASKLNPTPWHVEMTVVPELQPTHVDESLPQTGGARLSGIPAAYGYASRSPFTERPHPFS